MSPFIQCQLQKDLQHKNWQTLREKIDDNDDTDIDEVKEIILIELESIVECKLSNVYF